MATRAVCGIAGLCISTILGGALGAQEESPTQRGASAKHVPGRILVKFKDGLAEGDARGIVARHEAADEGAIDAIGVRLLKLPSSANERAVVAALRGMEEVEFAELDEEREPAAVYPNDPLFWSQQALSQIRAAQAWTTTTGSNAITIALLDTGVDGSHPDLVANLVPGWNFISGNNDTNDTNGHGTYMAGAVGAVTGNSAGGAGVCWQCKVMPLRVSNSNSTATDSTVASALLWARDRGIRIALVGYPVTGSSTVGEAARQFTEAGGIVVVPIGNDAVVLSGQPDSPYMLTLSGVDNTNTPFWWSNSGPSVDLTAPGYTYATAVGGSYANQWGSSFAAAHAAGVAALVKSVNGSCSGIGLSTVLKQSATDIGPAGWDPVFGQGLLNAEAAVAQAWSEACVGGVVATTTTLASVPGASTYGQPVTLTATVSPSAATGSVTFRDGGSVIGSSTISGGVATMSATNLTVGAHSLSASYGGSATYGASVSSSLSHVVSKAATSTTLASSANPSNVGQQVTFTATLQPAGATGTVRFLNAGTQIGSASAVSGQAAFSTSALAAGTHSITAVYDGDANYNGSSSSAVSQVVNAASKTNTSVALVSSVNPSVSGQAVSFTASVSPAAATGTVTFKDGSTTLAVVPVNSGSASLSTSTLTNGTHLMTAVYSGDSGHNGSTSNSLSQTVNPAAKTNTTLGLSTSPNPSASGQTVTLTANVTPSAATGTVTFFVGGSTIGSASLAGGVATLATSSLSIGTHSIQANYSGNTSYNPSISPTVTQTVNVSSKTNTTTTIASSANPSNAGQSVTFTANVAPSTATGTVSFYDGAVLLGTGSVSGGRATYTTAALGAGSHSISAAYGGSASFNGSTSTALAQVVQTAQSSDTIAPVPRFNAPTSGSTVTGTVTVSVSATDNVAVTRTELLIQGAIVATSAGPSLNYRWNTRKATGAQGLEVRSYDAANNMGRATSTVTVSK